MNESNDGGIRDAHVPVQRERRERVFVQIRQRHHGFVPDLGRRVQVHVHERAALGQRFDVRVRDAQRELQVQRVQVQQTQRARTGGARQDDIDRGARVRVAPEIQHTESAA